MQRSTNKIPLIMEKNPSSPLAESYRVLRTNLDFITAESTLKTIAVTSTHQQEGKTTTAVNLAVALAQAHRKVLLIDANMRQPSLHHVFAKPLHLGLSRVLSDQCDFQEAVEGTHIESLSLLSAGEQPPNPSELLSSQRLSNLLEEAGSLYDVVIVDSPSVLLATDAQIVASKCDGVLLVVHAGKAKKQAVQRAKEVLMKSKANMLGVVLNHVKKHKKKRHFVYDTGYAIN
jgi:capsular exopolysaccharide synthesis family protein